MNAQNTFNSAQNQQVSQPPLQLDAVNAALKQSKATDRDFEEQRQTFDSHVGTSSLGVQKLVIHGK